MVTEPQRQGSCQVNSKRGLQTFRAPESGIIVLRVELGGSVRGLGRDEINLEGEGLGGTGANLDVTVLENR